MIVKVAILFLKVFDLICDAIDNMKSLKFNINLNEYLFSQSAVIN